MDENSIITKIFYKKDAYTGQLRISKTVVISLMIFVLMFLFFLIFGAYMEYGYLIPEDIIISIILGLIFAVPAFVIGWIIGYFIDRSAYKSKMANPQQEPIFQPNTPPVRQVAPVNKESEPVVSDMTSSEITDSQINNYIVKIANTGDPFVIGEEYECQREYDLLKNQGNSVIYKIEHYLKSFAMNLGPSMGCDTWYYGGKNLVKLLGDINTPESLDIVAGLFSIESNITEWYWNILSQAAVVLGESGDEKYLDTLNNALSHSMAPADKINEAIDKLSARDVATHEEEVPVVEDEEEVPIPEEETSTVEDDVVTPDKESVVEEVVVPEETAPVEDSKNEDDDYISSFNKYI